jgi:membrane associated rhomboid family serine protease
MLPLAVDIRWRAERPPYAVLGLIIGMGLLHLLSWLGMEFYHLGSDWRWEHWALTLDDPSPTEFLSSIFAHANFAHWFGNSFYLWVFGAPLENRIGPYRFLLLFVLCGLFANLMDSGLFQIAAAGGSVVQHFRSLGASGAIVGIMGLSAARFLRARVVLGMSFGIYAPLVRWRVPLYWFVAFKACMDLLGVFVDRGPTNHLAHLFGFAAGYGLARAFGIAKDGTDDAVWDQAREAMDKGWWPQAAEAMHAVRARRPRDLEVHTDLLSCLLRLCPPDPRVQGPRREETRVALEDAINLAAASGQPALALSFLRSAVPAFHAEDLSERTRLELRAAQNGRRHLGTGAPGETAVDAAAIPRGVHLDEEERLRRLEDLRSVLKQSNDQGRAAEACEAAQRLAQVRSLKEWPSSDLAMALHAAERAQDPALPDYAEALAASGHAEDAFHALRALERAWAQTPKHPRLVQVLRLTERRLPELRERDAYSALKQRVEAF